MLSEGAVESIKEYGNYFFSEEGTYLRMYGGTKAPSLLPKYAIYYIVHKESVRQISELEKSIAQEAANPK